jgi:diguanylate cyclase (GGDEF)-like protein/PAS domain S-box-containing protein
VTDEPAAIPSERLLDALEVAVVVFDPDGNVLLANRRARVDLEVLGEPIGGVGGLYRHGMELLDERGHRLDPKDIPSVRTLRTGEVLNDFVMGVRSTVHNTLLWITVATQPLFNDDGAIGGVICTFYDITAQRNAQAALRSSEERFRLIAENAADVVYRFTVGPSPKFDYVNPAVESTAGYTAQEFYDDPSLILRVTHDEDAETVAALGRDGVDDVRAMQLRMIRRDGTQIWTEHKLVPLRDASGAVIAVVGIARDVTALKVKEAFLSHRALHDPLTGLPNRVLLLDRLEAALARIRRHKAYLAVLYLDLDRFKTVNDNLGHEVGDRLLQIVARRLQDTLRPSDSVARLGGDEFAAILPDLHDPSEATQVAERLLAVVAEPVNLGESPLVTTVSIGIASAGDGDASAGELLRRADFAMYSAKDHGRARAESYEAPDVGAAADDASA